MSRTPQKATSIFLMAIMVAGGVTFAFPHTEPAMAVQSNPNLAVSAENAAFGNYMSGAQVIEVVIIDPDIDETNESKGDPNVTINGEDLKMNQATDGKWYAYFASLDHARIADRTATTAGEGLDFGSICSPAGAQSILGGRPVLGVNYFGGADGVALPGGSTALADGVDFDANCDESGETSAAYAAYTATNDDSALNVVREAKSINGGGTSAVGLGQTLNADLPPGIDTNEFWPFIQLHDLDATGNVIVQYNRGGGTQSVTLTFDTVDQYAKLDLDRTKYPNNAQVHFDITDTWLNIDPTDEDSWTWDVEDTDQGAVYYQLFDDNDGDHLSPNIAPSLSTLMCETNCLLTLDRDPNGANVVEYQDNSDSNQQRATTLNANDVATARTGTDENLLTVTENSVASGVFTSYDENDTSVLVTGDNPPRQTTATIDYNETPQSILIEYTFATIDIQPEGDIWASGQEIPVVLTDADANRNSRADEDLDVFDIGTLIPTLVTGSPLTIGDFQVRTGAAFTTASITEGMGRDVTTIPIDMRGTLPANTDPAIQFVGAIGDNIPTTTHLVSYDFRSIGATGVTTITLIGGTATALAVIDNTITIPTGAQGSFILPPTGTDGTSFLAIGLSLSGTINHGPANPIVFDVMRFGFENSGEAAGDRYADQIIRLELEETADNTGIFVGTLEYVMANQLNILSDATFEGLALIDDEASLFVIEDLTDEDTLTVTYNDLGRDGVTTQVSDDEAAPSHSGSVVFDSSSYKIADTVTITVRDADLNTNSDTLEVYTIPTRPATSTVPEEATDHLGDEFDQVGAAGGVYDAEYSFGRQGRLLDVTFDDVIWKMNVCSPPVNNDNGLSATTFTIRETSSDSGVFEGDFQIPSTWCRAADVGSESVTGNDLEVNYVDYRDASGEIIEVGAGAGIRANTGSVNLDRPVYPVPFGDGNTRNADGTVIENDDPSRFSLHESADRIDNEQRFLGQHDLTVHVRVTDPDFDVSGSGSDELSQDIVRGRADRTVDVVTTDGTPSAADTSDTTSAVGAVYVQIGDVEYTATETITTFERTTITADPTTGTRTGTITDVDTVTRTTTSAGAADIYGPLKITVNRGSEETLLGFAGGSEARDGTDFTVIQDPAESVRNAIEYGPIAETAPSSGIFELDLSIAWNHGPSSTDCPEYTDTDFDPSDVRYCILQGDILEVEYTDPADASGNPQTVTDSATFDLRNGVLRSDKPVYVIGSDMILTLLEPDFDLDNDAAETYTLDLVEWDGDDSTVTLVEPAFDPEPSAFRETGDSTGIFQVVIEIPAELDNDNLDRGEAIELEYTDWGPAGASYVGEEDEDINLDIFTSNFGATIELDQAVYTWTDKVYITIVAPDHNFDSNLIDEIGETSDDPVRIYTREGGSLDNYRLVETGTDTGIFSGEVILTGFTHDADGDENDDITTSNVSGQGPTDGLLPAENDDGISVSFEFNEDEHALSSAIIRWNIADTQWLESSYPASGSGVVRVVDPDMNWNPEAVNNFDVDVISDTDAGGIKLTVTETQEASGIFEGTVIFTTDDISSGHRLRVSEGDTVTARYEDNTLPEPHQRNDELDVRGTTIIGTLVPPLERAIVSNVRLTDPSDNPIEQAIVGQQIQISGQITSGQEIEQEYAYLVQIDDANDVTLSLTWTKGTLNSGQSVSPSVSWQPTVAGAYTATVFVWESIDSPTALSPPVSLDFTVS